MLLTALRLSSAVPLTVTGVLGGVSLICAWSAGSLMCIVGAGTSRIVRVIVWGWLCLPPLSLPRKYTVMLPDWVASGSTCQGHQSGASAVIPAVYDVPFMLYSTNCIPLCRS